MFNNSKRFISSAIFLFVSILTLPIAFSYIFPNFAHCSLSSTANAQDNPCLAQDATISALEGALLQATLDSINHQATVEAYQSVQVDISSATTNTSQQVSSASLPFIEDFNDNSAGWELVSGTTISQGRLVLSGASDPVVPIEPVYNFYLEVDVSFDNDRDNIPYIEFGNSEDNQWHRVRFSGRTDDVTIYLGDDSNLGDLLFSTDYDFDSSETYTVGIWHYNGNIEIYVNDLQLMIGQIDFLGGLIRLGKSGSRSTETVIYDNLNISETR